MLLSGCLICPCVSDFFRIGREGMVSLVLPHGAFLAQRVRCVSLLRTTMFPLVDALVALSRLSLVLELREVVKLARYAMALKEYLIKAAERAQAIFIPICFVCLCCRFSQVNCGFVCCGVFSAVWCSFPRKLLVKCFPPILLRSVPDFGPCCTGSTAQRRPRIWSQRRPQWSRWLCLIQGQRRISSEVWLKKASPYHERETLWRWQKRPLAVCSSTRSDMHVKVDLDETQSFQPGGKRWKQYDVPKEVTSCADDAASKAAKEMVTLMVRDAARREQRLVDRLTSDFGQRGQAYDRTFGRCGKGDFSIPWGRMTNLEAKVQNQWMAFEKKWEEKIFGTRIQGGYDCSGRIQYSEMEKIWAERVGERGWDHDKPRTNHWTREDLRSSWRKLHHNWSQTSPLRWNVFSHFFTSQRIHDFFFSVMKCDVNIHQVCTPMASYQ